MFVRKADEFSTPINVASSLEATPGGTNWPNEPVLAMVYVRDVTRTAAVSTCSVARPSTPRTSRTTTAPCAGTVNER